MRLKKTTKHKLAEAFLVSLLLISWFGFLLPKVSAHSLLITYDLEEGDLSEFDAANGAYSSASAAAKKNGNYGLLCNATNLTMSTSTNHPYVYDHIEWQQNLEYNVSAWIYIDEIWSNNPTSLRFIPLWAGRDNGLSGSNGITLMFNKYWDEWGISDEDMSVYNFTDGLPSFDAWHYYSLVFNTLHETSNATLYMDGAEIVRLSNTNLAGADGWALNSSSTYGHLGVGCDIYSYGSSFTSWVWLDDVTVEYRDATVPEVQPDAHPPVITNEVWNTEEIGENCTFTAHFNDYQPGDLENESGIAGGIFSYTTNGTWSNSSLIPAYSPGIQQCDISYSMLLPSTYGAVLSFVWYGFDVAGFSTVSTGASFALEQVGSLLRDSGFEANNSWLSVGGHWNFFGFLDSMYLYCDAFPAPPNIPHGWGGFEGGQVAPVSPPWGGRLPFCFDGDLDEPQNLYGGTDGGNSPGYCANGSRLWKDWCEIPTADLSQVTIQAYGYNASCVVKFNAGDLNEYSINVSITDVSTAFDLLPTLTGANITEIHSVEIAGYNHVALGSRLVLEMFYMLADSRPKIVGDIPHGNSANSALNIYEETGVSQDLITPTPAGQIGNASVWVKLTQVNSTLPYPVTITVTYVPDGGSWSNDQEIIKTITGYDTWYNLNFLADLQLGRTVEAVSITNTGKTASPPAWDYLEVDDWLVLSGSPASPAPVVVGTLDLYFRSDTYTTCGISAYGLDDDYTNDNLTIHSDTPKFFGFRVWLVSSAALKEELTAGIPEAIMHFSGSETDGQYSETWACPGTDVILGYQALEVKLYSSDDSLTWSAIGQFISPVLITNEIEASTWTFTLYCDFGASVDFKLGATTSRSGIGGVAFVVPLESEVQLWRYTNGDYVGIVLASYLVPMGDAIYAIILLGVGATMYFRYKHLGVIVVGFVIFGGPSGLAWLLVPSFATAVVITIVTLAGASIVWRVIR